MFEFVDTMHDIIYIVSTNVLFILIVKTINLNSVSKIKGSVKQYTEYLIKTYPLPILEARQNNKLNAYK